MLEKETGMSRLTGDVQHSFITAERTLRSLEVHFIQRITLHQTGPSLKHSRVSPALGGYFLCFLGVFLKLLSSV